MLREHVRACTAIAVQEARQQKLQLSVANKFLHKVVKAQFKVSSMLTGKFGKKLGEKDRAEGQRMKTALGALEKSCVWRCLANPRMI